MNTEINKVIHYCWFGGKELPKDAVKCIESWKKFFPDYEIKRWDESNFDVNMTLYTKHAYSAGKYAFVSDFARFWILYNYGGVYFDTDVEVIKPFGDILKNGPFMGCQKSFSADSTSSTLEVAPGLGIAVYPNHPIYKEILDFYSSLDFYNPDGSLNLVTIVEYTTKILISHGLKYIQEIQNIDGIIIYPWDYFCPIDYLTGKKQITENTHSIHHYAASWFGPKEKIGMIIRKFLGEKGFEYFRWCIHKIGF